MSLICLVIETATARKRLAHALLHRESSELQTRRRR